MICPECDAVLKSAVDLPPGKVIRCPKCGHSFAAFAAAAREAAPVEDDEDEEYDSPPARRPRPRQRKQSSGALIIVPIVVGCLLLFCGVGVGAYFLWNKFLRDDGKDVVGANVKIVATKGRTVPGMPGGGQPLQTDGPALNKEAPEIVGEDIDGKRFKLSDYRGKVVVLDFWGNW